MTRQSAKTQQLPECDLKDCRVSSVGIDDQFAECLMEGPNSCEHSLAFGYCFLCKHPRVNEMLARSKQSEAFAA